MNGIRHFIRVMTKKQRLSTITLVLFIAYMLFDLMARVPGNTSHIWPVAGVVVAGAYIFGGKVVPGVFLGSALSGVLSILTQAPTLSTHPIAALVFTTGINGLAAWICVRLMKRWTNRQNLLSSPKDVLRFLISGPFSYAMILLIGHSFSYAWWPPVQPYNLLTFGFGNFVGAMICAPLLIAFCDDSDYVNQSRTYEWLASLFTLMLFGSLLLILDHAYLSIEYRVLSLILLPMFWIALRFNKRSVELFIFCFYLVVWLGSVYGGGYYALFPDAAKEINLQLFIGSAVILTLFTNAISTELHRSRSEIVDLYVGLELKVDERTSELTAANQQLYAMNDEMADANFALKAEIEERQRLEKQLTDSNVELNKALSSLKLTQNQLIQSEKMASLGVLVAGVAHEINSPVGVSITAVSHLTEIAKDINIQVGKNPVDSSEISNLLEDMDEGIAIILSNLKRASHLINSFKMVSTDQSTETRRVFKLKPYIDEIIFSLQPKLKKTKHSIEVTCSGDIEIDSFPGAFSQIFTNLIINSLTHAFGPDEKGLIDIHLEQVDNSLRLIYHDNGCGITEAVKDKIFDPFFTTNRQGGGTGLGLFVVYNIVTQQLGGHITCDSIQGEGTTFNIEIDLGGVHHES